MSFYITQVVIASGALPDDAEMRSPIHWGSAVTAFARHFKRPSASLGF